MIHEMAETAVACVRSPGRTSVWSPKLRRYVSLDSEGGQSPASDPGVYDPQVVAAHPPISSQFNLVFLTAAIGTLLFVVVCLTLTLIAGKEPPPLFEKVIMGFFDLAKIGFGAVVGLLGEQFRPRSMSPYLHRNEPNLPLQRPGCAGR